jgi:hypothetical protein
MFIPPGITSSGMRNPPEEWDSAGITSFILIQTGKIKTPQQLQILSIAIAN